MRTILFGDRLDFLHLGGGSANTSAAIIACAVVSCAWLFLHPGKPWKWVGLLLTIALSVLLIATKSRGGLIAAGCGIGMVGLITRPRIPRGLLIAGGVVAVVLLAYGQARGVWHRFTYGDDSRSDLWSAGLGMLWDVPHGVGIGNTSDFFAQWYQEIGDRRDYLSLINYHLDWLAAHGVWARFAYVLAWAGLAWFVWPLRRGNIARKQAPTLVVTAASVWLTFFVAAIFSTTANVWQTWVLPMGWLAGVAIWRIRHRSFPPLRIGGLCASTALFSLLVLHGIGLYYSSPELSTGRNIVRWGDAPSKVILYAPHPGILGDKWGHDLRSSGENALVLYPGASIPGDLPPDALWILSSTLPTHLPPNSRVHLFNIPATPGTLAWLEAQAPSSVRVTLSGSLCRDLHCDDWFTWSEQRPEIASVKIMGGVNLFIPSWSWFGEE